MRLVSQVRLPPKSRVPVREDYEKTPSSKLHPGHQGLLEMTFAAVLEDLDCRCCTGRCRILYNSFEVARV